MGKSAVRIGIYGGSFNPVHNGHIRLAEFSLSEFNLDKVIFVPSNRTAGKDPAGLLPASLRLACLRAALKEKKRFELSDCEIRRGGISYTVDTLREFKRKWPKAMLYFLSGADRMRNLSGWKSPDKVLKLSRFTILSRPGAARTKTPPGVLWASFPALNVSSSEVRRRLRSGASIRTLVPRPVEPLLEKFKTKGKLKSKLRRK